MLFKYIYAENPIFLISDVPQQPDDLRRVRPQDPGRDAIAGRGEDHALWAVFGHEVRKIPPKKNRKKLFLKK